MSDIKTTAHRRYKGIRVENWVIYGHLMIDPETTLDLRQILETMTESILVTDAYLERPGPYIVYVNPAFERMTGWSRDEVIGKSPRILQGPKTDLSIFRTMRGNLGKGKAWHGQTINYRKDGSEFHMSWSISPLINEWGEIYQFLAVQTDVTSAVHTQEQLEEAQKKERKRRQEIEEINERLQGLLADQKRTLQLFSKYVPESVVNEALATKEKDVRSSVRLDAALLFCDIRQFTSIAENLDPKKVGQMLNIYYERMHQVIARHKGDINQFVGDEIFATFGAPDPIENPCMAAVLCAKEMINALIDINAQLEGIIELDIFVGIGIHYGPIVAGNLGSDDRISYSITGDTVNTAKRIESLTREVPNAILVSDVIYDKVGDAVEMESLGEVQVKGRRKTFKVYQVMP